MLTSLARLLRVRHGVAPPPEARLAKRPNPVGMRGEFHLGGEEHIAVEIDARVEGRVEDEGHVFPVEKVGFVGGIGGDGLRAPFEQVPVVEAVFRSGDRIRWKPLAPQKGQQFLRLGFEHDPPARQVHPRPGRPRPSGR